MIPKIEDNESLRDILRSMPDVELCNTWGYDKHVCCNMNEIYGIDDLSR